MSLLSESLKPSAPKCPVNKPAKLADAVSPGVWVSSVTRTGTSSASLTMVGLSSSTRTVRVWLGDLSVSSSWAKNAMLKSVLFSRFPSG
ncbi:MAG: PilN domain-containing protein [Sphingomicrobium sp.]